ncbi:MAG TPA: hypothetical protein VK114_03035 [Nitrososphaerales archaeon]|nr:hypothetical protein [Nitrososphaerales archaeon]
MSSEIAEKLSQQTSQLVSEFEKRLDAFSQRDDLMGLTLGLDSVGASSLARKYFGEGEHIATGVDGSRDYDERLQMMLFYSNATAYSCPFIVGEDVKFELKEARREAKLSATSAIPLWLEDVISVMPDLPEGDIELEHSIERIPNAFMTLGELYLALKAVEKSRIIFLDRPISGTHSTLSRDYRILLKSRVSSNLTELVFGGSRVSMLDLRLGLSLGAPWVPVPARPRFLKYAVLRSLMESDLSFSQLASALLVERRDVEKAVAGLRKLDAKFDGTLLSDSSGSGLKLREDVRSYWQRLTTLASNYGKLVFEVGAHPLLLPKDRWLTVFDVNTISLLLLEYLCEVAQKRRALLIGIAKDTTATDITRATLPFAEESGYIRPRSPVPRINNDKAFLSILSSTNLSVKTPWRTFGYDACFSTMRWRDEKRPNFFAARKVVSREGLFTRGFFQLRTLRTDPHLRSSVFLFDRVLDGRYDTTDNRLEVEEKGGVAEVRPYFEPGKGASLSNLALYILSMTDNPEVSEAFGHNQLLYLADKAVKTEVRLMRSSLRGVADLRVGRMSRRKLVSGVVSTFREQRLESEEARVRGAASYGD